jgi:hypothetical protein
LIYSALVFAALAAPPQIRVEPNQTVIRQNAVTVTIQADGSISVKGPNIDLVLPGSNSPLPPGPNPRPEPAPAPDELAEAVKSIFGGLQEPTKTADALALARSYRAINWHQVTTVGDLANSLRGVVPATRFAPVRERTGREILAVFGDDPDQQITNDMKDKGRVLFARIATILEDVANGR